MSNEERKVKFLEKTYKMGRWNVAQKGLVTYDKSTFDREIMDQLTPDGEEGGEPQPTDVEGMDTDERLQTNQEAYDEANDISGLGEDYQDGYGEDGDMKMMTK
jgi:hypothetical protein